jgi:hypothetical protein
MSHYAIALDAPHSDAAAVCWRVIVTDNLVPNGLSDQEMSAHYLWVPPLESWTLDHVRMTLHEIAAFLPVHDQATAGVVAKRRGTRGRPRKDGTVHEARFDDHVELRVFARGWRAEVWCWEDSRCMKPGENPPDPGQWSAPMQAALLDLAAKSPFPLDSVDYVEPEFNRHQYPARQDVVNGDIENYTRDQEGEDIKAELRELRRWIDEFLS